jgi:hypothetical protein
LALLDWDEIDMERQALIKEVVRDHTRALLRVFAAEKRLRRPDGDKRSKRPRSPKSIER